MSRIQEIRFYGDCLEALGIPDAGDVLYDRDLKPRVLDLVVCEDPQGSLQPYLKRLLRTGKDNIVTTCYKDRSKNFAMRTPSITGVVVEIRDREGRLAYRRRNRTFADDLRAMSDEELAEWIMSTEPAACPFRDDHGDDCRFSHCKDCWLDWLRQESGKEEP